MNMESDPLATSSVRTQLSDRIRTLLHHARTGACADVDFTDARRVLECLPLTQAQFATATNRLANAHTYLQTGERGAALFELRLLLRSLQTLG
jgi:hypothetical protein